MRLLGAILAGGQARRFGSDKALAMADGARLIDRVAAALAPQVDALAVVGRDWPPLIRIADLPGPGLGPLGGLAGALDHGARHGFDAVLTAGCDLPDLPADLVALLCPAPALIADQPTIGLWPVALAPALVDHLASGGNRAMRGWADRAGARRVAAPTPIANINAPADLAAWEAALRPAGPPPSR